MILRIRFAKIGKVRWTSHRDVARIWERALRRADVAVSYTKGFSPRPQLSFGLALPTGCESNAEYLDVALESRDASDLHSGLLSSVIDERVTPSLPDGISVLAVGVPDPALGSLQEAVTSCTWKMDVRGTTTEGLRRAVDEVMSASSLPVERERKGRRSSDDLRPSVLSLNVLDNDAEEAFTSPNSVDSGIDDADTQVVTLAAELATRPRGVRPAELARAIGVEFGLVKRTCQWIEREGSKFEPLEVSDSWSARKKESVS
jgi:radical SAM-linked protein